ncbi:TIGR01841 family phasin [Caballeronia humi]|jgi:phasin family protein|uniref:Phasin family protein n=1 Tax=Caballeronia humi TaxID=326474 RepID=A0A158FY67_9BURK|nr:TIGR01841 family phasin [Caballeronia humi]SAL24776.1 phasin family protein [Caballeronia humi]
MSSLAPEQIVASQKAGFDTFYGLAAKSFEGFEKLVGLNVQTVRTSLAESQELVGKALSVRDPQELIALQTSQAQAGAERLQAYWRDVYAVVNGTRSVFAAAAEAQLKKSQDDAQAYVDSIAKNAPAGSEAVVTAWKSAFGAAAESANSAYEAAKKAAKDVVEAAETNASAASKSATQLVAAGKAASSKK